MAYSTFWPTLLFSIAAFWLGACPFAVWIGKLAIHKDVRNYGDGNPGTVNVFRAGSIKWGILTLIIEMGKGFILVALANIYFQLPLMLLMIIGLCAILGHAFSPILKFRGGKALAVTGGVLLALPPHQIFIVMLFFTALFYLFVEQDSWTIMLAITSTLIVFILRQGHMLEAVFIFLVILVLAAKHFDDLKKHPVFAVKPARWLHINRSG